ncbi:MAG: aldo/keto reductase [Actinobacteria bacterium]|nr:aldo/keto reductase [Actinomycetota bacterium]
MRRRVLGGSGIVVSELALGTMVFGEGPPRGTDPQDAAAIIRRYLEAGGNHLDTADVYAGGRSEEIVGEAIAGIRDQVVLATKVRFTTGPGPNDRGLSRLHIVRGVEDSLRRLRTDHVDLLYMHTWDPLTRIEESLRAFDDLVSGGKVRAIGVSNFTAWQVMKSLGISDRYGWARFTAAQYQHSLVVRDVEREFVGLCEGEGIGMVPWSPLGGGFLSGKYRSGDRPTDPAAGRLATQPDDDEEAWDRRDTERNWAILAEVERVAAEVEATPSQVALAWLLTKPVVSSVIVGVRTMAQLDDNLGAAGLDLPAGAVAALDEASAPGWGYPYRFLGLYGSRTP